jgi:lysophospholipase L1-like esterase
VILVGLLPCLEHELVTKELFKKASNGLRELSQKNWNCYFIPIAKSFINGGKINEKYFRDGVHLTPEGSQMYADVLCKRLVSLPVVKNPKK